MSNDKYTGVNIALEDLRTLNVNKSIHLQKKEILQKYIYILKHVKENPLLEDVISIYTDYFADMYKQIDALKFLLTDVQNKKDVNIIRNEIKNIKTYLPG